MLDNLMRVPSYVAERIVIPQPLTKKPLLLGAGKQNAEDPQNCFCFLRKKADLQNAPETPGKQLDLQ